MIQRTEKICRKCGLPKMKSWEELTDDQQLLAEKLPMSAEYPLKTRKKHRYCTRCWFEDKGRGESRV